MAIISRRNLLKSAVAGATLAAVAEQTASTQLAPRPGVAATGEDVAGERIERKGRIRQSVCRWCYAKYSVDDLARSAAHLGMVGVDLLEPDEYEIPRRHGLICTMGYAEMGRIASALNRLSNHDGIEAGLRKHVASAVKAGVPNLITFSGNRAGMSDDEGLRNCVMGLNRIKKIAEDHGVVICLELLNSRVDHHDYMADHSAWGFKLMEEVNSPHVRLLYDIYHMQIQEGDLIRTIRANIGWIGHFHTGGVPGRHELNDQQEIQWGGVMRAIAATGYRGVVAHEFLPTAADPMVSLRQAVDLCDV